MKEQKISQVFENSTSLWVLIYLDVIDRIGYN